MTMGCGRFLGPELSNSKQTVKKVPAPRYYSATYQESEKIR